MARRRDLETRLRLDMRARPRAIRLRRIPKRGRFHPPVSSGSDSPVQLPAKLCHPPPRACSSSMTRRISCSRCAHVGRRKAAFSFSSHARRQRELLGGEDRPTPAGWRVQRALLLGAYVENRPHRQLRRPVESDWHVVARPVAEPMDTGLGPPSRSCRVDGSSRVYDQPRNGQSRTRYLPQRRYENVWVPLGVFLMNGTPSVSLSNKVTVDQGAKIDDIAWDAVGFQPPRRKA